jgi:hypothetical protein
VMKIGTAVRDTGPRGLAFTRQARHDETITVQPGSRYS